MSVKIRPYLGGDQWEVDIRLTFPNGQEYRERRKAPVSGRSAALRWAQDRERHLVREGPPAREQAEPKKEVPTLREFAPRFLDGYARANQQKPSGIAAKETILRCHLVPALGEKRLGDITTEHVQQFKARLTNEKKTAKTVNNILTVLNTMLRTAVDWREIQSMPCTVRLLKTGKPTVAFHDFEEFERLIQCALQTSEKAYLSVLLSGEAGLRCGEIMGLRPSDVDLAKRQICVAQSDWKGHVTLPKGGRIRYVPLTARLTEALRSARHLRGERVLCDGEGKALTQKVIYGVVRRAARMAGVKPGVHVLRHTFCSHLAMRGAPARAIQELAGHQDLRTTQRYMHLSPLAVESAIRLLETGRPNVLGGMLEAAGTGS